MASNLIKISKVTLNIGTGEPGEKLDKAVRLLQMISGAKPVQTVTQKRIPTWKIRPGLAIGCKVTLRRQPADALLRRLLKAVNNTLKPTSFDDAGNVSFGIPEYLEIPGAEYDAQIGIIGLEVAVTLQRPGFRIKRRALKRRKVPRRHQISQEDAITFMQAQYGLTVGGSA